MIEVSPFLSASFEVMWTLRRRLTVFEKHYADGDLVNSETPVSHTDANEEAKGGSWGPEVPEIFLD